MPNPLTPAQIRGARGMLGWSMVDLAKAAAVSVSTVKRLEMKDAQPLSVEIRLAVWDAFEQAGVTFTDDGRGKVGVTLASV